MIVDAIMFMTSASQLIAEASPQFKQYICYPINYYSVLYQLAFSLHKDTGSFWFFSSS